MNNVLELKNIVRSYQTGAETLSVLKGVNFQLRAGELVALVGPSGAGKSTLLHTAGLLEQTQSGQIIVAGEDAANLKEKARTDLRARTIGFVYQFHHLLPEFSAEENIVLPQMMVGASRTDASKRALMLLDQVGLTKRVKHRPAELSGGEQQRVAIARALANNPRILLADEPTGNLDPNTAEDVFDLLISLTEQNDLAAIIATHNFDLAKRMNRKIELRDGLLLEHA